MYLIAEFKLCDDGAYRAIKAYRSEVIPPSARDRTDVFVGIYNEDTQPPKRRRYTFSDEADPARLPPHEMLWAWWDPMKAAN